MASSVNIAVYLYPGADILDFAGPVEIYSNMAGAPPETNTPPFNVTTFASETPIKASFKGTLTLIPDATLQDVESKLTDFDILLVPGAEPETILKLLDTDNGKAILQLIQKFTTLPSRQESGQRIVQSVCTGALILAAAGILASRTVTSHHMAFDLVKQLADKAAGGESNAKVVNKRWVDAGLTDAGVRIVNAGGVTSGIDASLFIVDLMVGKEAAEWVANLVEFERRAQDDGWGSK